ncbi:DUF1684 domain-containing protein [Arthrobacter agilis]|uniref:DUF1684 domain-containing protein n=1 Tax=Arthrobacter agilis TaxID=37921 RepID=UPI000B359F67|nr:DUF1684 domain-containing protein [Arthrobacter agilis]OUM40592.1 hypothetical protein B8W74_13930 [Arthrobacter agilis]PPB45204.1 DUF1684 domain-containing protein [Arthrobacter agilis]TPV27906.1 DUF1684 domain-containing protein [Arthrobacter agilis]VDR31414.1 Protein of uncharacterised function (DUF1684) [Arthrobacter agilis]
MTALTTTLATADWRRRVFGLYEDVRRCAAEDSPEAAHGLWQRGRNDLLRDHPASALHAGARTGFTGLEVAAYDPTFRFEVAVDDAGAGEVMDVATGTDGVVPFRRLGTLVLPGLGTLALWKLASYGGGLFLPLRDATAGTPGGTYGGGRYVLDTVKGAHLGEGRTPGSLVVDLNFAYNPSCAYDEQWACPLPGPDNRLTAEVPVGELYRTY